MMPLWRFREHLRRTAFGYWWNVSHPESGSSTQDGPRLAVTADMESAKVYLRRNIRRTDLVEANFTCIERFAQRVRRGGAELVVLEGFSHPDAMSAYDGGFRSEARNRLAEMARANDFDFVTEDHMPKFSADDFGDAYHLNEQGREKLTNYLAQRLQEGVYNKLTQTVAKPGGKLH